MVAFNTNNIAKIAQLNPTDGSSKTYTTKPIFIFEFNSLPTSYQFNLNIVLFGLQISETYLLKLRAFDNNDTPVVDDAMTLNSDVITFDKDKLLAGGIGSSGFNIRISPITISEEYTRTLRIEVELQDFNGNSLDRAHTFLSTKLAK